MIRHFFIFTIITFIAIIGVSYSQQDLGDIYKYKKDEKNSPIYQPTFSIGAGDADNSIDYYIGCDDSYGPPKILSDGGQTGMAFDCYLRFYGQRDEFTTNGPKSVAWDFFDSGANESCNNKSSCPIRSGSQPYVPGSSPCSGRKHYIRWGGIHDGSNSLSKTLTPVDKKNPIWNEIEFKIVMSTPGGSEMPLIPSDSGWVQFSDDIVTIADNAILLSHPDTIDFSAWIMLSKYEIIFPISFQNCEPGRDDNHLVDQKNSYNVKFKIRFPYAEWSNSIDLSNKTNGLNILDKTNRWEITLSERKFFIWDKVPPKIDFTFPGNNCELKATTGDPMYSNNKIRFKVIDDNPNQELDTVTVTLSNGSFSKEYKYSEGDSDNTIKKPTIKRKTDINADDNFIAEFEVEFTPPPNGMKREDILKSDQYFIAPHDSLEPIKGEIVATVMHGVIDPATGHDARDISPDEPPSEFTIIVTDNDPPGLEVGFILMKSPRTEIMSFVGDFSSFPTSKKACGIKAGTEVVSAEYCLDLDTFGTPIDFSIYPFGRGSPVLKKSLTTYSLGRKSDVSPSEVTIDVGKFYPKKSGLLVIEDERYYYVIKTVDNIAGEVIVKLKQEVGCLTLNQKGDTPIKIKGTKNWLLHRVYFTNPEEKTYIVLNATDASNNTLFLKIPFKILNSILNWTSIDNSSSK